jgi:aquaporin Z
VATYIAIEAPISGMSLNPARTLASNVPAMQWNTLWVYLAASPLGMLLAATAIETWRGPRQACAKLLHSPDQRCIHCGYEPAGASGSVPESKGDLN